MEKTTTQNIMTRFFAPVISMLAFFVFLLGSLLMLLLFSGRSLDHEVPGWGIWLLVLGGGLGSGAARYTYGIILRKFGGFSESAIEKKYRGY